MTHGDLALEAKVDFLAVVEHRLIPARVRSEWDRLRRKGMASVWALACQDSSHVGNAGVGVVSMRGAPVALPSFAPSQFKVFFDCGRVVRCLLPLGAGRFMHLCVHYGYQGADTDAEQLVLTNQLFESVRHFSDSPVRGFSPVVTGSCQFISPSCGHTHDVKDCVQNNNNNTPWPFWPKIANAQIEKCSLILMVRQEKRRGAPAPVVEYISPAPAVIQSPMPVVEFLAPASAVIQAATPVVEYVASAPADVQAPTPVVEYRAPVPAVFQAPTPVVEFLAPAPAVIVSPVEEYIPPAPSARTQFFSLSLSPASSDVGTLFPIVTGTKSRKGIETPTSSLLRRRPVDEAGHVLDVQVERVMRASVARLGYEWRCTKK